MITAADIQMIRNADPGAVLPGIDTMTGNTYATSTLLDVTKIIHNSTAPYFYTPSRNTVTVTHPGAVRSSINPGTATVMKALKALLVSSLLAGFAPLAQAHIVYPGCYAPPDDATGKLWYFDPVYGTTVSGGADGSKAHPFRNLSYAFQTGQNGWAAGAGYPHQALISTQTYDHYPKSGVHGTRFDDDWNPAAPDPTRINPGDAIVLETGSYGDLLVAGFGGALALQNVNAAGATDSIFIQADAGAVPLFTTVHIGSVRGFLFTGLHIESIVGQGAAGSLFSVGGTVQDISLENSNIGDWGTALPGRPGIAPTNQAVGMPPWTQAQWIANMRVGISILGSADATTGQPTGAVHCINVVSNNIRWTNHGLGFGSVTKSLAENNTISHFSGDAMDIYSSSYITAWGNVESDRFDTGNGDHPDFIQLAGSNVPGTFPGVILYHNWMKQLTDPVIGTIVDGVQTPPPGDVQGLDATNNAWSDMIVEDNYVNAEACLIFNFGSAINSKIVNNTAVWSGGPKSSCYPWLTVGQANVATSNNLVENNVIAGSVWRANCTNGDVWKNNRVYRIVAAGAVQSITPSGICISNGNGTLTHWNFVGAGAYDGVVIDASTPMAYVFADYAPTSPLSPVNVSPTPYGPLYGTGAVITGVPGWGGGLNGAWPLGPTKPNIGAL
jgi:hypothetical protein